VLLQTVEADPINPFPQLNAIALPVSVSRKVLSITWDVVDPLAWPTQEDIRYCTAIKRIVDVRSGSKMAIIGQSNTSECDKADCLGCVASGRRFFDFIIRAMCYSPSDIPEHQEVKRS
jgi:hypothetical protein